MLINIAIFFDITKYAKRSHKKSLIQHKEEEKKNNKKYKEKKETRNVMKRENK